MKGAFEMQSNIFVKNVFVQAFPEFSSYWQKLQEIGEKTDVSIVQLSGNYSKTMFLKNIKTNFYGVIAMISFMFQFTKSVEKMSGMITKQISPEDGLLKNLYNKLTVTGLNIDNEIEIYGGRI